MDAKDQRATMSTCSCNCGCGVSKTRSTEEELAELQQLWEAFRRRSELQRV